MQLSERQQDSITIIHVSGTMTEADKPEMRAKIGSVLSSGRTRIVLNFAELTYMDSAALGELVACQLRAGRAGATLKIAGAERRLNDLLVITRLITVFDAYESLQAALESFAEDD